MAHTCTQRVNIIKVDNDEDDDDDEDDYNDVDGNSMVL